MLIHLTLLTLAVPSAFTYPIISKRQTNIDTTILQFALTLEHLEDTFYKTALSTLTQQHFHEAGFGPNYFNNIQLIAQDEASHVKFLSNALTAAGVQPVQSCTYNFPMTDVPSFIALSNILEGVGTSAYLGGAPLITSKEILTAAGSILVTEALHTSLQRTAIKAAAGPNPFGTPLDPNAVFTLAASFITECPASNAALPFTVFPSLTAQDPPCSCEGPDCNMSFFQKRQSNPSSNSSIANLPPQCLNILSKVVRDPEECNATPPVTGNAIGGSAVLCQPPAAGATVAFTAADIVPAGSFTTFVSGLMVVSSPAQISGNMVHAVIPEGVAGQTYVMVTSADAAGVFDASTVLFGPAILEVHPAAPVTVQSSTGPSKANENIHRPVAAMNGTAAAGNSTSAGPGHGTRYRELSSS